MMVQRNTFEGHDVHVCSSGHMDIRTTTGERSSTLNNSLLHDGRTPEHCRRMVRSRRSENKHLRNICQWSEHDQQQWIAKCFQRRETRRHVRSGQMYINSLPWRYVQRKTVRWDRHLSIASWNVRSMLTLRAKELIIDDLQRHQVSIACLQECRWDVEEIGSKCGEYKLWGGGAWRNREGARQGGVAIAVHKSLWQCIERFQLISGRVLIMSLKGQLGKQLVVCSAYSPTESDTDSCKDMFWNDVQKAMVGPNGGKSTTSRDLFILCGDFNGELPSFTATSLSVGLPYVVGRWGQGDANTNGLRLLEEAASAKLCSVGSLFRRSFKQRWTFFGSFDVVNSRKRREYDHIFVPFGQKAAVQTVKVLRSFLHDSDHCPVIVTLKSFVNSAKVPISSSILTKRLRSGTIVHSVESALYNRFAALEDLETTTTSLDDIWSSFSNIVINVASTKTDLPVAKKPWISDATLFLIHQQATLRSEFFQAVSDSVQVNLQAQLKRLRREIHRASRSDYKQWVQNNIVALERAHALGDSRQVYQLVNLLGKKSCPPASLEGTDPEIWVKHFRQLLGEVKSPKVKASAGIQQMEAWKLCDHRLNSATSSMNQWNIPLDTPTQTDVFDAIKSARKNKAVAGIIPTEFFLNSQLACKVLTILIGRIWNGEEIPSSWLNAALCLLYKNKGSKSDPNSFRGISLLTSAEKIMSIIVLKRIKAPLEQRLLDPQAGFRSKKSCANAAFVLERCLEEAILVKELRIFNFVDFSKAFDSLDWDIMWKVLLWQGMPLKFVELIRKLYMTSTISVRLSMDGAWAPAFGQKVGIRQGCSLSPALFVLVLDFALRAFEDICSQQNIPVHWLGYADDLVLISATEVLAQQALHQLQAACAFVGLFVNVSKTECMAVDVQSAEIPKTMAMKERVSVRWDHAEYSGWLMDWSGRSSVMDDQKLTSLDLSKFVRTPPSHLLIYDDGEFTPVLVKKSGWLMDGDGDKHRFKHLGFQEFLDSSQNKFRCLSCSSVFSTARALATHSRSPWCRKMEDLSIDQARQLRHTRYTNEKRSGKCKVMVTPVKVLLI